MGSSAAQMYPPIAIQQQVPYQAQLGYQNPYPAAAPNYNHLVSAYGQLPTQTPPSAAQTYAYDHSTVGLKRPSDEVLTSVDLFPKRPRPDSGGNIAFYPQRPGEKLCAFYMTTRTCSFGLTCKFDHPSWVPYGGIPNWKEVTAPMNGSAPTALDLANLPQRPGEPNCAFYMKKGDCKYGPRCKFNHPKDRRGAVGDATASVKEGIATSGQNGASTPATPTSMSTPTGATASTTTPVNNGSSMAGANSVVASVSMKVSSTSEKGTGKSVSLNSKGFPVRQNESECTFYVKTGSCKFGTSCRFNHPEVIRPGARGGVNGVPAQSQAASMATQMAYPTPVVPMISHPQRPGDPDCTYYLKTGECSFGPTCRFNHPPNRQPSIKPVPKLTLAGLPRREGEATCAYYMKTGSCKYGSTCRFDHPPPAEVAAKVAAEAARGETTASMESYEATLSANQAVSIQYVDLNIQPSVKNILQVVRAEIGVKADPES